jgi:quercetin dioxygenase-like cupin family protein
VSASRRPLRTALIALLSVAILAGVYTAGVVQGASSAKTAVREALASSSIVKGASGRTLGLSRVTIPAGAQLALHHHPGTQIASIQQGTLTYTVKSGSVTVRSGSADKPKVVRTIKAGQTGHIKAGQWIVEQPTEIHKAANNGKHRIVILLATLFPKGSPPSIPDK